jgi:hypothetical protein
MHRTSCASMREHARERETEYREKLRQVDVAFGLKRVALRAGHQAKVAAAEAEFQKKLSAAMTAPGAQDMQQRIAKLEADMKSMSTELSKLKQ